MVRPVMTCVLIVVLAAVCGSPSAQGLSIRDVQYTTDASGTSPCNGTIVDCAGGVVIHKFGGGQPRLQLYDPADPTGWGGIQVKDFSTGAALFANVSVGDWVSFDDILVEDYRGTTFLQYDPVLNPAVSYAKLSSGNPTPAPVVVSASEIAAPTQTAPDYWLVADHSAEKYESMWLKVEDVTVTELNLGKASDNYNLNGSAGNVWNSDYLDVNKVGLYDPKVSVGQHFLSVTGMLEQYTKSGSTYGWDYYQFLTTSTNDLVIPEPAGVLLLAGGAGSLLLRRRRP